MRETPRTRHEVSRLTLALLRPFFRRSWSRDAWVLRGVGNDIGPVLVRRRVREASTQRTCEAEGK